MSPVVNLFGLCVEGEVSYEHASEDEKKGKFYRDYTTFVYDLPKQDVMLRFGDVFSRTLSYQSVPRVWGLNVFKDVSAEKSQGRRGPIQITLLRKSTVEVYVDGNLIITRTNVVPGTYTFDDIGLHNGSNNILIKIIDDTGREQYIDESCFYEGSFVPKGSFTFDGTYGYPEIRDNQKGRYDKKKSCFVGDCEIWIADVN
jgi:outer membrane usher protein FimD/PapC